LRIFIFQQREWYFRVGKFLAKRFLTEGYKLGSLTFKKSTHQDVIRNAKDYELIINHDQIVENPLKFVGDASYSLEDICNDLEIDSIWEIVQSARNHVKNYNLKTSYSFKQNLTDKQIEDYFISLYCLAQKVKNEFNPDIILLPAFVSLPHIIFNIFFKKYKIPTLGVIDTKVDKIFVFINDYLARDGKFFKLYNETDVSKISFEGLDKINEFKKNFYSNKNRKEIYSYALDDNGFKKEVKLFLKTIIRSAKSIFQKDFNKIKLIGNTPDNNNIKIIIRDYFFYLKNKIQLNYFKYDKLEDINNFIYFPLQSQPEDSIDIMGVKYNNQIETIRQIAMKLPGNLTLLVKDHPAMSGIREKKYLNKIKHLPNVKLVSDEINVDKILDKTKFVIFIIGTIAFECAMKKIKCIQLGEHGLTRLLPNVTYLEHLKDLPKEIKYISNKKLDEARYDDELNKYIYCSQSIGFDHNYLPIWEKNETGDLNKIFEKFNQEIKYYLK